VQGPSGSVSGHAVTVPRKREKTMKTVTIVTSLLCIAAVGCATAPRTDTGRDTLISQSKAALNQMTADHPELNGTLKGAEGYAVFPSVGAGGFVVGAAYGHGVVYQHGNLVGYASISSVSAGAQAGGETYNELIVFQTRPALDDMENGDLDLTAKASAVVLKPGAAVETNFENGVAVFVRPTGGAMVSAAVGGQHFTFEPVKNLSSR
jgi:lipid-binding SYLF domain-containing protein